MHQRAGAEISHSIRRFSLFPHAALLALAVVIGLTPTAPAYAAAPVAGEPGVFVSNLYTPDGIITDSAGNVYVYHPTIDSWRVTKFRADGTVVWSTVAGGLLDVSGRLSFFPLLSDLLLLTETGQISTIDPETGLVVPWLNLLTAPWDTSAAYDVRTGLVVPGNLYVPSCDALPVLCSHKFGDLAVFTRGGTVDLYITGHYSGIRFVLRARSTATDPVFRVKLLLVSSAVNPATGSFFNYHRGIAANSQGKVLTTLPFEYVQGFPIDVALLFDTSFDPLTGPPPTVISNPQAGGLTSKGMAADTAGNFYVASGAVGNAFCGLDSSGALVTISADGQDIRCRTLGLGLADSRDVALSPRNDRVYMTVTNLNEVLAFQLQSTSTAPQLRAQNCSQEGTLRSTSGGTSTAIRFVNQTAQEVRLFWLDYDGQRRSYGFLAPGGTRVQPTYTGHPWLVANASGQCLAIYLPIATQADAVITTPGTGADLAVSQTDSPDPATVGTEVIYTVTVTNAGSVTATRVSLSDTVPAGVSNIRCTDCARCSFVGKTLTCPLGDLTPGASATWLLHVTPAQAGALTNTVRVTSDTVDQNQANNVSTATTTVR